MIERRTQRDANIAGAQVVAVVSTLAVLACYGSEPLAPIAYVAALGVPALVMLYVAMNYQAMQRIWLAIGAGMALWAVAGALATMQVGGGLPDIPSLVIDAFYVAGYVPMLIGLVMWAERPEASRQLVSVVDWLLVLSVVYGMLWMFVVEPVALDPGNPLYDRAFSSIYAAGDIALVLAAYSLLRARIVVTRVAVLLVVGLMMTAIADVGLLAMYIVDPDRSSRLTDLVFLFGCGLLAVAAVLTTGPEVGARAPWRSNGRRHRSLVVTALAWATPGGWCIAAALGAASVRLVPLAIWIAVVSLLMGLRAVGSRRVRQLNVEMAQWHVEHDAATGLYRQPTFIERAAHGNLRDRVGTVLWIKVINLERYMADDGELVVDALLGHFGSRLRQAMSSTSLLARVGLDEFAVFVRFSDSSRCALLAEAVLAAMNDPVELDGARRPLLVSVGVAQTDGAVIDLMAGLRRAREAQRHAESNGPDGFAIDHELTGSASAS